MPPTHALSRADAPCIRPLRRSWLVRSTLYALLFVLLTCLGDQHNLPESPARSATVPSAVTLPAEGSDGGNLDPFGRPLPSGGRSVLTAVCRWRI